MLHHRVSRSEATRKLIQLSQPQPHSVSADTNSTKVIHTLRRIIEGGMCPRHRRLIRINRLIRYYNCSIRGCRAHFTVHDTDKNHVIISVIRTHDFDCIETTKNDMPQCGTSLLAKHSFADRARRIHQMSALSLLSKPVGHIFKTFTFTSTQIRYIVRHFAITGNQDTTPSEWYKLIGPSPSVPNMLRKMFRVNAKFDIQKHLEQMFQVQVQVLLTERK